MKASRDWVCIRLLTYENESEYKYMERLLGVTDGTLPNTVFCLLSPDGKTKLTRPTRGPSIFRTPENMAIQMKRMASRYQTVVPDSFVAPVPLVDRVDLTMNVAASDNRPMVVFYHPSPPDLQILVESARPVVWDSRLTGQFMYAATSSKEDLKAMVNASGKAGVYIVEPDEYGVSGKIVRHLAPDNVKESLKRELSQALANFQPFQKNHQQHIRDGYLFGIEWETLIPESDPMSVQAKQRFKARFDSRP
ncbi:MAG: hypothetical protein CMJ76_08220 [Planctomycetaceae bacterium]|nr:hypothetical protein [Planctomycetaceae bacterium]